MACNGNGTTTNGGVTMKRVASQPYTGGMTKNSSTASLSPLGEHKDWHPKYRPLRDRMNDRIARNEMFFSLEFFPPRTSQALANFYVRLDRLNEGGPLFCDVTWHMGSDPGSDKQTSSSSVAAACLNYCLVDTMLHVTCAQYTKEETLKHLAKAKELGLRNLLALRGDLPPDVPLTEYKYKAVDLVKWIREEYGDYFTIAVAGYPKGHPDSSYTEDILNLKAKCDAGADMVVTQLFFEAATFIKFVRDCREVGITVPIVPGIMPIMSYENIKRIAQLSKLDIPQFIMDAIDPIKDNAEAVSAFGVQHAIAMCKELMESGVAPSLHMYTLNRESQTRQILMGCGLWRNVVVQRALPWKDSSVTPHPIRHNEDVRPIFWSSRPQSYIYRTKDWDGYPNGRWGNTESPAFGDLTDYYLFYHKDDVSKEQSLAMWGTAPKTEEDIFNIFACHLSGAANEGGVVVSRLPWTEKEMSAETQLISGELTRCAKNGFLFMNSQPNVNGAPSADPLVGWGRKNGYCYQKAYVEFLCSRKLADALLVVLAAYKERVNYHMISYDGSMDTTNNPDNDVCAVTWGVFPGCEIAQPTVVDPIAFRAWRDEAYELWRTKWISLYEEGSEARKLLTDMHDSYCLVNLIDNFYPDDNVLFDILDKANML